MVHIYTGDGKGKTTAAVGLAVRAGAAGKKVLFFQFLKSDTGSERAFLSKLDNITVLDVGEEIPFLFNADKEKLSYYKKLYKNKIKGISGYEVIIFDEAIPAMNLGLVSEADIFKFAENSELVITGRGDIEGFKAKGDYITIMQKEKHPFDKGVSARCGIEY